jgi:hypothetical protein
MRILLDSGLKSLRITTLEMVKVNVHRELLRDEALRKKQKICLGSGITVAWFCYVAFLFMGGSALVPSDFFILFIGLFVIALMTGCLFFALERKR